MNIVLVRLSAIGDCCLVLPVVRAILAQDPEARINWLIGRAAYELLQYSTHPRLTFQVIDKPRSIADYWSIRQAFHSKKIDLVLAMQASTRANLIYPLIKAKQKIGFDKVRARELQWLFTDRKIDFRKEHLHESFCQFAELIGVKTEPLDWSIALSPEIGTDFLHKFDIKRPFVAINPAASKLERSWMAEHYAEVIDWLQQKYKVNVVLTGGKAEFEKNLAKKIIDKAKHEPINLVGKTKLDELAYLLSKAQLLIAPDTGPAHIANGVGTKVIGLYAVAPSWLSGPYLHQATTIDKFELAVKTILGKDPAQLAWKARVHDRAAMDLISPDEVKVLLKETLSVN